MDTKTRETLWKYFKRRLDLLEDATHRVLDDFSRERDELIAPLRDKIPDEVQAALNSNSRLAMPVKYGFLISACSLLEDCVKQITRALDHAYREDAIKRAYRRNWLINRVRHLKDNGLLDPDPELDNHVAELDHAIKLRNCIGHAWGNINECRRPQSIRSTIAHYQGNDPSSDLVDEFADHQLLIGDDFASHVLFLHGEELIRILLQID